MCLWTKYRTALSFIFRRQSGNSNSIHVPMLQWELWRAMCVKCLTWCLACHTHAQRNPIKKKRKERNWSLSQKSLILLGSATPWQLFQIILDVTMRINCEDSERKCKCMPGTGTVPHNWDLLFFLGHKMRQLRLNRVFSKRAFSITGRSLKAFPAQRKPVILSRKDRSHQASKHLPQKSAAALNTVTAASKANQGTLCVLWASPQPSSQSSGMCGSILSLPYSLTSQPPLPSLGIAHPGAHSPYPPPQPGPFLLGKLEKNCQAWVFRASHRGDKKRGEDIKRIWY